VSGVILRVAEERSEEQSLRRTLPAQFTQCRPISAYMHNTAIFLYENTFPSLLL
jgi:hypothetical protein